ncbi:MAG: tetraacyldisaccharide 4'-kinase [Acidobacteriaceae bacterium]
MSRTLAPLVPLYAAAVRAKNLAYERGWARPKRLRWPVVSIGNLSMGGSGKTPLTIRLAQLLSECGFAVDVLSRGYGRQSNAVERVTIGGLSEEFGDEPLLIAQSSGVPVFVSASRYRAGLLAETAVAGPVLHLLDDGFQHRRLARDVDIVVLHRSDFAERLLPAGRLREGFSSLSRAQILVMRQEDHELEAQLQRRGLTQPVWWMKRQIEIPEAGRVIAFCAIAREEEFFAALRSRGVAVMAMRAWRDHHCYTQADIAELIELRRQHEAEAFLTTEKDLVRLQPEQKRMLESAAPVHAAKLLVTLVDEAMAIQQLCGLLPVNWQERTGELQYDPMRK